MLKLRADPSCNLLRNSVQAMESFDDYLELAHRAANEAGAAILPYFRKASEAQHKGGAHYDPVTAADIAAETRIRAAILSRFPHHGVAGEEFPPANEGAEIVWTVDPIDGTRAFIMGLPVWGTLIGISKSGTPLLGVMDQPFTGERFWNDETASWHREPRGGLMRCQTRTCTNLDDVILTATTPDMFDSLEAQKFEALTQRVRMRRFGGDCYAYAMLALGHIDMVVEASLKAFDIVPLIAIVEKAGGIVTSWDGGSASQGGQVIACGDRALHQAALDILNA